MTPEERRKRAEHVAKLAEQGVLAEPSYDREAWRAQEKPNTRKIRKTSESGSGITVPNKTTARPKRRTA